MSIDNLNLAVQDVFEEALRKMLQRTAEGMVNDLSYDTKQLVTKHLENEVAKLFNTDQELRDKIREKVVKIVDTYRVPTEEERSKRSRW